jgi:hypothetical protein
MTRKLYQYCNIQKKVVPIEEVQVEVPATVAHKLINDEMPATLHPIDQKYYTSKSRFRAVTKAHGYEEVGTAYDNGYDPAEERVREEKALVKSIKQQIIERWKS